MLCHILDGNFCDCTFKNYISFRRNCVTTSIETSLVVVEKWAQITVTNQELGQSTFFTTVAIISLSIVPGECSILYLSEHAGGNVSYQ